MNSQVIVMGADVTHLDTDQQCSGNPSIAAVVDNVDPKAAQYLKFNQTTGSTLTGKPLRIIFYRDEISEGQLCKVFLFIFNLFIF